jgi:hypothetical protein
MTGTLVASVVNFSLLAWLTNPFSASLRSAKILSRSGSIDVEARVGDFTKLEGRGHDATAGQGNAPASRVRNLGDPAVGLKSAQEPSQVSPLTAKRRNLNRTSA